ncbi:MAG: GTPase HflX [Clostridia bacterium]|nr:GTPase HflX [Clostridia bacterium]
MEKIDNRVITVSVYPQGGADEAERSLLELERLVDTAGGEVFATVTQLKNTPDVATCIGEGKLNELADICKNNSIKKIVFDCELTPAQIKNIENVTEADVIDRSMLILDIFALHATTAEGKIQVELAQLKYTAPRLMGKGKDMSRLGGGIGTRGPGESKLEIDRRRLASRMAFLQGELRELEKNRLTMRAQRDRSGLPKACIAGYTNAGKSTLLNLLTGAGILAEDKLFATLDPTTRKYQLPSGIEMLITDTVGFIRKLPHHLIHAFKSTLDETVYSDFIIVVVDASDDECLQQMSVTEGILESLEVGDKPRLYVFNKADKCTPERLYDLRLFRGGSARVVTLCAKTGEGLEELTSQLEHMCRAGKTTEVFLFPYTEQGALNSLYNYAEIKETKYIDEGVLVEAVVDSKTKGMFKKFLKE